jgi:DNA-binding HxlR family transcriptional regulator
MTSLADDERVSGELVHGERVDDELPAVRCSVARSLDVLGEKWTLLVIRDALRGKTRFSEFRNSLHVSTDILTDRLATLVAADILERRAYREAGSRERYSYHLTESGRELSLVLAALTAWGDKYRPSGFGPATLYRGIADHAPVTIGFSTASGGPLGFADVEVVRGPGSMTPGVVSPLAGQV